MDSEADLRDVMAGVLALLAAERDDEISGVALSKRRRTEVVLADAGLQPAQIAALLGKKANTVGKIIRRARKSEESSNDE